VGEVEAQLVRAHRRAGLADVRAEPLAQRRVQQVRRRVIAHRRVAKLVIDRGGDPLSGIEPGAPHPKRLVVADPVDVLDPGLSPAPGEHPRVRHLTSALGVEGALLELDEQRAVVRERPRRGDRGLRLELAVADEVGRRRLGGELDHRLVAVGRRRRAAAACPRALFVHQRLEALVVDRQALLGQELLGQVVREAVGVMEAEGILGVDPGRLRLLSLGDELREQLGPAVQRAAEALLLVADPAHDQVALGSQVRVRVTHQLDHLLAEASEEWRLEAEDPALLDRTTHDPAQHVPAVLVRRNDAVGDQVDRAA
jgi:hypothetical protein